MKKIILILLMHILIVTLYGQQTRIINIQLNTKNSTYFDSSYKKSMDSAFIIVNAVFNSKEFQSIFDNINFPCWNKCIIDECEPSKKCNSTETISGETVLNNLFEEQNVTWTIFLKKTSRSALGSTCPKTYYTTAFLKNIKSDMPDLPLSYAIAVNLCHEYMHQIGFCHYSNSFNEPDDEHPDHIGYKNDIAYRIGWDSYYILKRWYESKTKIFGL